MRLTYLERMNLMSILPKQASYPDVIGWAIINEKLLLKEDEAKEADIEKKDGMVFVKNNNETDVEFTDIEMKKIKDYFVSLNDKEQIGLSIINLYEKIVLRNEVSK